MLSEFIKQTSRLIKQSDIRIHVPTIMKVENNTHFLNLHASLNSARLSQNFLLNVLMFFGMLDAYVDSTYPSLVGESYAQKLRQLPNTNLSESVLKDAYRIYKVIRNATIHNAGSITSSEDRISIQYQFRDTQYEIEISKKGLEFLHSIVYEIIYPFERRSIAYSEMLRVSLLTALRSEIFRFNDEHASLDRQARNEYAFAFGKRYRPENVIFTAEHNLLTIQNPYTIHPDEVGFSGVDYEILKEGKIYLVPSEAMNNGTITLDKLSIWILSD
ncbi:hypothetical protein [Paenibacillus peoriae]|uniref:hypothetical protein n=1 Tax=Paenibacillus peoriae TaxID=59893 RepID=UPI00215B1566|nr:hypothetical protein [Paenibacillus peoriae]